MSWKASPRLMETIKHYASFPATGVSLRQMVQFGKDPSVGVYIPGPAQLRVSHGWKPPTVAL